MTVERDPSPQFESFAHPERLVSTEWLAEHLDDPGLVVVESDEDVLLYETGHIPGAVKIDWHTDLNDPVTRDYVDGAGFALGRILRNGDHPQQVQEQASAAGMRRTPTSTADREIDLTGDPTRPLSGADVQNRSLVDRGVR